MDSQISSRIKIILLIEKIKKRISRISYRIRI